MYYENELNFFRTILNNFRIHSCIIPQGNTEYRQADRGLRDCLGLSDNYNQFFCMPHESFEENHIYKIRDEFHCNYIFILLPDCDKKSTFVAGPFVDTTLTQEMLLKSARVYDIPDAILSQVEKFYTSIPVYTDRNVIISLFNSLGEKLWGNLEKFSLEEINLTFNVSSFPEIVSSFEKRDDDALFTMRMLENRYDGERRMIQAVSLGQTHKAEQIISHSSELMLEMRVPDPIRNIKNYTIIVNTLCRKAVEQGGVHPLYIDEISTGFAKRIEKIRTVEEGINMHHEMIYQYCELVNKHSMKNYSPLIQKVIALVDFDLTADLTLHSQADRLNVNASYLSTLFKKETGMTLTEYVAKKRIDHSAFLLRNTNMQIQNVAQNCGIYDVNYFTKMFKKRIGKTPKEYREASTDF